MTISRSNAIVAGLAIALFFFVLGLLAYPAYVDREWRVGAQAAQAIARKCGVPDWALYYDFDGRRSRLGWGPGHPSDGGIYLQSNYGHCPEPGAVARIKCAESEAGKLEYRFIQERHTGGCDENEPE